MINQELNQTQKNNFIALIEPPIIEKRGIAKRSDNFLETVENGKRFEEIQKEYAYFKNDAKRILNDNQRNLGLNQSEVCILNTLVTFSSVKSWAEGKPISLAPFGSMLSKWEDEGLMQWKLNKKEQITGKKQTKQKIMITRDDKIEYKKQTKSLYSRLKIK